MLAGALAIAGRLTSELGDPGRARSLHERALALAREIGDDRGAAWALHGLGDIAYQQGGLARARELFEESLALFLKLGDLGPAGGRLSYLAGVAMEQGDADGRARLLGASAPGVVGGRRSQWGQRGNARARRPRAGCPATASTRSAITSRPWTSRARDGRPRAHRQLPGGHRRGAGRPWTGRGGDELWAAAQRLDAEREALIRPTERARYERWLGELPAAGGELSTGEALALALELARA